MKGHIDPEVKRRRSEKLIRIAEETAEKFYTAQMGTERRVLFEKFDEKTGLLEGLSDNYIKVYCKGDKDLEGEFAMVEFCELCPGGVKGILK